MQSFINSRHFIENIVDGMYDWVRVLDRDDNIIYMNKAMTDAVGTHISGLKCYEVIGRKEPCQNCTARKAVFDGIPHEKEECIGDRIFSVMSSPVRNKAGEIIGAVEVLRETTNVTRLQKEILRQHNEMKEELNIARKLQKRLLPKDFKHPRVELSYIYKPCEALGGDFLDIFEVDAHHLGLYIADVSGHGIPASMLTVFLKSSIDKTLISPAAALKKLYSEFNNSALGDDMYITVFYAIIDTRSRKITYSNAGHNMSPLFIRDEKHEFLWLPGIPISNWVENPEYEEGCTVLKPGDTLFFSTDGIIEIRNKQGLRFGTDKLMDYLSETGIEPPALLEDIVKKACEFADLKDITGIPDDITMALLKIK